MPQNNAETKFSPSSSSRTQMKSWRDLSAHYKKMEGTSITSLFSQDPKRFEDFHARHEGLILDYSKQRISGETLDKLLALAKECDITQWRDKMFAGDVLNITENRAVLHVALRDKDRKEITVEGENIIPLIQNAFAKMKTFTDKVRAEKKFTHIVNIGIGGSDLGPHMVCEALKPFSDRNISMYFVSNVDATHLAETLHCVEPEKTLFIVTSKTFTTQETMTNAISARKWLQKALGRDDVSDHFVAATQNVPEAIKFGVPKDSIFPIWDWVGGRYSLWSAIGLSFCFSIGFDNFQKMLDGAYSMDKHFLSAPLEKNIPVILALIGVWHRNFENFESVGIMPYDQYLHALPSYMQQLDMESNGKSITRAGHEILDYQTGPIIMGQPGTDGQHAFFQLVHQGTTIIPSDFIFSLKSQNPIDTHHEKLLANAIAQTKALMDGRSNKNPHKVFKGNRPSNSIVLPELSPYYLGMLLALYEHKVFVQGIIWDINSFDQCGVELGKKLANQILEHFGSEYEGLSAKEDQADLDSSTLALMKLAQSS